MSEVTKRSTIYFKPELHRALRIKAAETQRSLTDLVNDAVQMALREDEKDISAGDSRVSESTAPYEELRKDPKINEKTSNEILKEILALKPVQKAELVDKLISSLDEPDKEIDELWIKEVESRIDAYEQGKIKAVSLEEVLEKYR
jgi:putative addiction module component (TIGR02574 family)